VSVQANFTYAILSMLQGEFTWLTLTIKFVYIQYIPRAVNDCSETAHIIYLGDMNHCFSEKRTLAQFRYTVILRVTGADPTKCDDAQATNSSSIHIDRTVQSSDGTHSNLMLIEISAS